MSVLRGKSLGFQDEGGERVEKILVGDVVAAVNEVEAAERNGSPGAVDVIEEEFLCQNIGIVVTFVNCCERELPSCRQQLRYRGNGKGLEKGELQSLLAEQRELHAKCELRESHGIPDGIHG